MAFDPDKYLQTQTAEGFNPDAYLGISAQTGVTSLILMCLLW